MPLFQVLWYDIIKLTKAREPVRFAPVVQNKEEYFMTICIGAKIKELRKRDMKKQKKIEKSMEFRKYYLSEFQLYDGEVYVTFNIVAIDTNKNEITVAISNRGRIRVTTYDLLTDNDGSFYFEYGVDYEKINVNDFEGGK